MKFGRIILLASALACGSGLAMAEPTENDELTVLYQADQADRRAHTLDMDWKTVGPRDEARRKRVKEMADAGELRHSADFLHAAMIYQHGDSAEHYRQANLWALRAVELNATNNAARWLACAAEDRWLQKTGKPQVWGTQYMLPMLPGGGPGKWTLEPFDRNAKTDAERVAMGVPTLAGAIERMDKMNAELLQK